jgi:hypothetical protein
MQGQLVRCLSPLHQGGLGISDLECFGRALRLRWLWFKWKTPNKPWCDMELPVDGVDEALFAAATRVTVHNGKKAKLWTSSWLEGCSPTTMFPALFKHSKKKNHSVADAMSTGNWIRDVMHNMTAPLFLDYVRLWHLIASSSFSQADQSEDDILWTRTANGTYSTKSAYNM